MAEGKTGSATLRGYYEADWLGAGITSNDNQSNSYVFRQRVLWGQIALNNGWAFRVASFGPWRRKTRRAFPTWPATFSLPKP